MAQHGNADDLVVVADNEDQQLRPGLVLEASMKNPRGKLVKGGQKAMCCNLVLKMRENEELSKTDCVRRVSASVGIGQRLIWGIIKEIEENTTVKSPPITKVYNEAGSKR